MGMKQISPTEWAQSATLCIPARNEALTIGRMIEHIQDNLLWPGVIDEILVIDDRSVDGTGDIASRAGARVVRTEDVSSVIGEPMGKGDAIWTSIAVCRTDLIGWIDGDLTAFDVDSVGQLFTMLRDLPWLQLVKGAFDRMSPDGELVEGRLTVLTARPLLQIFYPELARLYEPLGGIFAMRTPLAADLSLDSDYGVDVGMIIDVLERCGPEAITEVHMGILSHRSRSLEALADTAHMISRAILSRAVACDSRVNHAVELDRCGVRRTPVNDFLESDLAAAF